MALTKRQLISTAAAAGSAAVLAPMRRASAALDKISVAVIPIADCAPIYLGKAKGFFAKQNLDVELSTQGGGAAIIPGVLSGQLQFGFSNVPSLLIAQNKGLKFVGIAPGVSSTGIRGNDFCAVLVPGDSPINSAKDLTGKTVAVNNLNNIGEVAVRAGVKAAGGDPKSREVHRGAVSRHAIGACRPSHRGRLDGGTIRHHRAVARRQGGRLALCRYCAESR